MEGIATQGIPMPQDKLALALKEGIRIEKNGIFEKAPGQVSLFWHPGLKRYCLAYGTGANDAGFVLIEDFERLWTLA